MSQVAKLALAVAGFSLLLFALVIGNELVLDDAPLIRENPFLRRLGNIPRFFTSDYWEPRMHGGLYRPLVTTTYALNHAAGSLDPRGYHVVNLLLHAANSALVLLLVNRWSGRLAVAVVSGFLFAAHAVHTEPLANISSGRPELMAAVFFLLALWTARMPGEVSAERFAAPWSLACFALALLCKESAITLLAVVPIVDAVFGQPAPFTFRRSFEICRQRGQVYASYALIALAYLGLRWYALSGDAVLPTLKDFDNPLIPLAAGWRIITAIEVGFLYLWLLIFPMHLSYDYSYDHVPLIQSFGDPNLYAVLALATAAAWGLFVAARRSREVFFGCLFALATFSVVSNVPRPIGTIMAERLMYLPSLGFSIAAAVGLHALAQRVGTSEARRRQALVTITAIVVALHGARAVERSLDWRTENGLYVHDLSVNPRSAKIQSNGGAALAEMGRHEEALVCYTAAIAIAPEFAPPYRGSVLALLALERYDEAHAMYQETLRFGPPVPSIEQTIREGQRQAARDARS